MEKAKRAKLTSKTVTWLLLAAIVLLIIGAGVGSWLMQSLLKSQVAATDHAKIDAELSQTELQRSKTLETYFAQNQAAIDKAAAVVSDTKTYQYQNQIVNDIQTYANKAGVTILGYTFPVDASAVKADATGLKSVTASLQLKKPLAYTSLLKFLKYIEQNVTKMQITDLSLQPDPADSRNLSNVTMNLKVYVR